MTGGAALLEATCEAAIHTMMEDKQPISAKEASRLLKVYMNPVRVLQGHEVNFADARAIELVSSVEAMIEEERPVPAELRLLADVMEKKGKEIAEARAAVRVQLEDVSSRWMKGGYPDLARYKEKNGSGIYLFRAYLSRRKADRQQDETRKGLLDAKRAQAEQ